MHVDSLVNVNKVNIRQWVSRSPWFWVMVGGLFFTCYMIYSLSTIIFPFILGFIGAYAMNGSVQQLTAKGMGRGVASALMVLIVLLSLIIFVIVFIPFVQEQLLSLISVAPKMMKAWNENLSHFSEKLRSKLHLDSSFQPQTQLADHAGQLVGWGLNFLKNLFTNSLALANLLSLIVLTPVIMFYMLKDFPLILHTLKNLVPYAYRPGVQAYFIRLDDTLTGYAKGQTRVCLVLMVLYAISLWLLGIKQGVFIGIMTGIISFIPYMGALMGLIATLASAFSHFESWGQIGASIFVFAVIGAVEGNYLAPQLIGGKIGLHPVWIIFSLLAGGTLLGFSGIIFALPTAAIIGVSLRMLLEKYKASSFYETRKGPDIS